VTALANGAAEVYLTSDLYGDLLEYVIVVSTLPTASIPDAVPEDSTQIPDQITPVQNEGTVEDLIDELIALIEELATDGVEAIAERFDGDTVALTKALENGDPLSIELDIDQQSSLTVNPDALDALTGLADDVVGEDAEYSFLDISPVLYVNGNHIGNMTELDEETEVSVTLPAYMRGNFTYRAFRYHDGEAKEIRCRLNADGTLSLFTDRFSPYMISYEPKTTGNNGGTSAPAPVTVPSPNTGDTTPLALFILLAMASVVMAVISCKKLRRKQN
jgi:hypothetical protein